jgi:hypothetical protein
MGITLNLNNNKADAKWRRMPLKSSWYDDHVGFDASPRELVENRVRNFESRFLPSDEEGLQGQEIERFFDLFEPRGG